MRLKAGRLGAVALLAVCVGAAPAMAKTLVYCSEGSPENFTPAINTTGTSFDAARPMYDQLVIFERGTTKVVPGLAESWTVSADGRRYTFTVRAAARWSNGDRLVAEDFAHAFRRLVNPATASQYALMLEPVVNASDIVAGRRPPESLGVSAPDEATLIVRLAEPSPYFIAMLSHPSTFPVHRPTLAARPQEFARPGVAVTNGAFTPSAWEIGSHIVALRNKQYWNDAANRLDAVRYVHVADPVNELTRFRAGDLDVTYTVPPGEVARLEKERPGQLRIAPHVGVYYYGLALDLPPFDLALSVVLQGFRARLENTDRGEAQALIARAIEAIEAASAISRPGDTTKPASA